MANNIEVLRGHLFRALEALNDPESPMDIGRAKAVAEIAQVVINSAKVEVEHLRVTQGSSAPFFLERVTGPNPNGVTVHRAK